MRYEPKIDPTHDVTSGPMDWVLLPAGSVVHQNGVPVQLITGAVVLVARGNMSQLVGHHLCGEPMAPKE